MEAQISAEEKGWVVWAWVVDPDSYTGRYKKVAKFAIQSDAIEIRNLLQNDGMSENRVKALIKSYDGVPKKVYRWSSFSGPSFRPWHEEE